MEFKVFGILDAFKDRMAAAQKKRDEKETELKKVIGTRQKKVDSLKKDLDKINAQKEKNDAEYVEILKEREDEFSRLKQEKAQAKKDHEDGKISLKEFLAFDRKDRELLSLADEKCSERLSLARAACSDVARERLRILAAIEEENSWIGVHIREFWKRYIGLLNMEKNQIEKSVGFVVPGRRIYTDDYSVAKGEVHENKRWEPKSWDELKMIVVSGIVQEKHFDEFSKMLEDLRFSDLDFERHKLMIDYRAGIYLTFHEGFNYKYFSKLNPEVVRT